MIRRARIAEARKNGVHTTEQWEALKAEFDYKCVECGIYGMHLDKDHIIPIYQGGSDGIDNIQPLCARCNARKGPNNFNWVQFRRQNGFEEESNALD